MSNDVALDFGTSRTRVADERGDLLFDEPTLAAIDDDTGRLLAFGNEAQRIGAAAAGRVVLASPVTRGQIVDLDLSERVLNELFRQIGTSRLSRPRVLVAVHVNETNVQRRALERALRKAGPRQVLSVEQTIACAIGAGLTISEPQGSMTVDVGAGTTDIAVLALGGVVTSAGLGLGGDMFDEAIRDYLARHYGLFVDHDVAREVKHAVGDVSFEPLPRTFEVAGRLLTSGDVGRVVISAEELAPCLDDVVRPILDAANECIATSPPDLANDLLGRGMVLAGAGALITGLDQRFAQATGVAVHVNARAGDLAVLGAAQCLSNLDAFSSITSLRR